jgi:tetratricopeptide (TPR) repeat protein
VRHQQGRYAEAIDCYDEAVALFAANGDPYMWANTLENLGATYAAAGPPERARACWLQAAALFADVGDDERALAVRRRADPAS